MRPSSGKNEQLVMGEMMSDIELNWLAATPREQIDARLQVSHFLIKQGIDVSFTDYYVKGVLWQRKPLYSYMYDELIGGPWDA